MFQKTNGPELTGTNSEKLKIQKKMAKNLIKVVETGRNQNKLEGKCVRKQMCQNLLEPILRN
jgi:hypothetical protein